SLEVFGMAVDAQVAVTLAAITIKVRGPVSIVNDKQIQPAVVVVVKPAASDGPLIALDSRFFRNLLELSVAQVAIKNVAVDACHKQISMAVVVVVRRCGAHRIACSRDTGLRGNVGEFHSAVISIQAVEELWRIFLQTRNRCAVREKNVNSPVVVVIKGRDAAGHRFDHVLARRGIVLKNEVQAGTLGNLAKANGGKRRRGLQTSAFSRQLRKKKGTCTSQEIASRKH